MATMTQSGRSAGMLGQFASLFSEFAETYLEADKGREHLAAYPALRTEALASYERLCRDADAGRLEPDQVLLRLLPWGDSQANRARGAWIHIAPAIQGDIVRWFEGAGWTSPEDWPRIANAILTFVRRCVEQPADLPTACREFSALPYSKGFQTGLLTPALNALRPDNYL